MIFYQASKKILLKMFEVPVILVQPQVGRGRIVSIVDVIPNSCLKIKSIKKYRQKLGKYFKFQNFDDRSLTGEQLLFVNN
jgi:hypothetical protein